MSTTIRWKNNTPFADGHRIYKSSSYFTKNNLPAPLVDLGPDVTEYTDTTSNEGESWYIVGSYLGNYEVYTRPFVAGTYTAYFHDIFADNSIIATYPLDYDANDLGDNYNGTEKDTAYALGAIRYALRASSIEIPITTELDNGYSFSAWIYPENLSGDTVQSFLTSLENYIALTLSGNTFTVYYKGTYYEYNTLSNDQWHHVVVCQPQNGEPTVYFNKTAQTKTQEVSYNTVDSVSSFDIGNEYNWEGKIDQVRLFNRMLSQEEVNTLYKERQ